MNHTNTNYKQFMFGKIIRFKPYIQQRKHRHKTKFPRYNPWCPLNVDTASLMHKLYTYNVETNPPKKILSTNYLWDLYYIGIQDIGDDVFLGNASRNQASYQNIISWYILYCFWIIKADIHTYIFGKSAVIKIAYVTYYLGACKMLINQKKNRFCSCTQTRCNVRF